MDSEAYWAKRSEEREAAWQLKSRETLEKELAAYYEASLDHIQRNIDALYGRFAKDNALPMEEARKLLTGKEYRTWRMSLEEYVAKIDAGDKMLERELNTLAMRSRISRLDKLYSETLMELDGLGRKTRDRMDGFLGDAYRDNYYRGLYEIGHVGKALPAISQVDSKSVEAVLRTPWSGKNYSTRIWKNQKQLAQVIQDEVVASVHRGEDVQKVSRRVAEKMGVGLSNAQRLVRTELNYVHNQAALDSIRDAEMDYFRFVATLDSRTSTMCREHDGKIYPIDAADTGENIPPLHPRCRSIIVGSLGGKELKGKTRIAKGDDGKYIHVPAEMNYEDFQNVYVEKTQTVDEWKEARAPKKEKPLFADLVKANFAGVFDRNEYTKARAAYDAGEERIVELKQQVKKAEADVIFNPSQEVWDRTQKAKASLQEAKDKQKQLEKIVTDSQDIRRKQIEAEMVKKGLADQVVLNKHMEVASMEAIQSTLDRLVNGLGLPKIHAIIYDPRKLLLDSGPGAAMQYSVADNTMYLGIKINSAAGYKRFIADFEEKFKVARAARAKIYAKNLADAEKKLAAAKTPYEKLSAKALLNAAKFELEAERYIVANSIEDTLIHEYGHFLHLRIEQKNSWKMFGSKEMKAVKQGKVYNWNNTKEGKVLAGKISYYAGENPHECFAEAFNAYVKGEKLPEPLQKMVKEAIEKELSDEWKLMRVNLRPPTDNFIAALAKENNLPYTIGKKGVERFYADNGKPIYPPNSGVIGEPKVVILKAGTEVFTRYGQPTGRYISKGDVPFELRAMPFSEDWYEKQKHYYVVVEDITGVESGAVAPWFGQPGGSIQYKLPKSIVDLEGKIKEL